MPSARIPTVIYYNTEGGHLSDATGAQVSSMSLPRIAYKTYPLLLVHLVDNEGTPVVLPAAMSFSLAIDTDYDRHTNLICKSYHSLDVNQPGDWDQADATAGRLSIRVNANTTTFADAIGDSASISATAEIQGRVILELDGTPVPVPTFIAPIPVVLVNMIDVDDSPAPTDLPGDYYTAHQVDTVVADATAPDNFLQLGITSTTAHRGDHGKTAYDHSQAAHAPSDATAAGATGDAHAITPHAPADATADGVAGDAG